MSKIFETMTIEEQKAWWLEQAKKALISFEMTNASIEWLAYTHNAVFQVEHDSQTRILRLSFAENSAQVEAEYHLLNTLYASGLAVSQAFDHIRQDEFSAILLSYLEGISPQPDTVSVEEMQEIGQFLAHFHSVNVSRTILQKSLDWDGLFSNTGIYYPGDENMTVFSDEQLSLIDAVAEKVKLAMNEIGQSEDEFGLIHGDFLLKNILFHNNEVRALDFEYCGWGYYLYDLTPILWQLKPQARYPQLEQALWDGYNLIRPLTAQHRELLETFIAGRQVASMYWIAANQQNPYVAGKVEGILAQRTAELSAFLETGILKRE